MLLKPAKQNTACLHHFFQVSNLLLWDKLRYNLTASNTFHYTIFKLLHLPPLYISELLTPNTSNGWDKIQLMIEDSALAHTMEQAANLGVN